jgi:hypothetical protein
MDDESKKPVIVRLHPEPEEYIEAETMFLREVGVCITQWAFIDRLLFRLFRQGIGAPTHRAAVVYYDQHSINSRLRQVDVLMNGLLEDPERGELRALWKNLRDKLNSLLPTRNIIAHQPVRRLGKSDGKKAVYEYGIYIEPYQRFLRKQHKGMKGKDALLTEDLIEHSEAVAKLEIELTSFAKKIVRALRSH